MSEESLLFLPPSLRIVWQEEYAPLPSHSSSEPSLHRSLSGRLQSTPSRFFGPTWYGLKFLACLFSAEARKQSLRCLKALATSSASHLPRSVAPTSSPQLSSSPVMLHQSPPPSTFSLKASPSDSLLRSFQSPYPSTLRMPSTNGRRETVKMTITAAMKTGLVTTTRGLRIDLTRLILLVVLTAPMHTPIIIAGEIYFPQRFPIPPKIEAMMVRRLPKTTC